MPSPKSHQEQLQAIETEIAAIQKDMRQLSKRATEVGSRFQTVQDKKKVAVIKARIG